MPRNTDRTTDHVIHRVLHDLFLDREALVESVVADGWPRPMVEEGFELHRKSWDPDEARDSVMGKLWGFPPERRAQIADAQADRTMAHLWPQLPGAGVSPVLLAAVLGTGTQVIRPSRAGRHFAEHFVDVWRRHDDSLELCTGEEWRDADLVVVSGSDQTVKLLVQQLGRERVIGYGHRVSFVVYDDRPGKRPPDSPLWGSPEPVLDDVARDIVLWHQMGCFSVRGVLYLGAEDRGRVIAARLAKEISKAERKLGATIIDEVRQAERMQRLGRAEFQTDVWKADVGWVELRDELDGEWISPHAVSFVITEELDNLSDLQDLVTIDRAHLQGVAVRTGDRELPHRLEALGVTRVCRPGELQAPPVSWPHDGMDNVEALVGPGVGRAGR